MNRKQKLGWVIGAVALFTFVYSRLPGSLPGLPPKCGCVIYYNPAANQKNRIQMIGDTLRGVDRSEGTVFDNSYQNPLASWRENTPYLIYCETLEGGFIAGTYGPEKLPATEDDYFEYRPPIDR